MPTTIESIVALHHSPSWEIMWIEIQCHDGETYREYRCGHEFTALRVAVRAAHIRKLFGDDTLTKALQVLERSEAQRNRDVANLQIEWMESRVQRRLPRALVWLAVGVFGLAFWACATLKLLELVGYVFAR